MTFKRLKVVILSIISFDLLCMHFYAQLYIRIKPLMQGVQGRDFYFENAE